tara:strand:+ start:625 stop:879 length:255 start_codon:yes stop_codon:yes gene_type:complete
MEKDLQGMVDALNDHYSGDIGLEDLTSIAIIEDYVPDSPGWRGDIALIVYGASYFKDILYRIEGKWTWVEGMNEGDYTYNDELI